jgi:hypothetical protein
MRASSSILLVASVVANGVDEPDARHKTNITGGAAVPFNQTSTLEICEARTINYITHMLPQSCLTSSWKNPPPTSTAAAVPQHGENDGAGHNGSAHPVPPLATPALDHNATATQDTEPAATTFMSFEDWKEMMLRRAGQDPQDLRSRKPSEHGSDDRHPPDHGHAGLGEEGEISLNFEHYADGESQGTASPKSAQADSVDQKSGSDTLPYEEGTAATVHLSKDAGKTCKERFSYSSFDAGATILKTSPGAKNARAILVENKDTYMLLECDAASKYVIVELSDDISVDTVVLANFEFFSSMVRHFRVSVSDRYPVKMDKWRELGTFEARNSRDIQPFLVKNPQIWAKYVRIEFLTHFGNEYYCPISLLRIHGSRMLDSWKDSEGGRDEDSSIDGDESGKIEAHLEETQVSNTAASKEAHADLMTSTTTSSSNGSYAFEMFTALAPTCPASSTRADSLVHHSESATINMRTLEEHSTDAVDASNTRHASLEQPGSPPGEQPETMASTTSIDHSKPVITSQDNGSSSSSEAAKEGSSGVNTTTIERHQNPTTASTKVSTSSGQSGKARSSVTTGASAASPTMQESFFNSITKRLQYVESNLTLSMKYVEDQSKHVQEALQSGEQKQHAKITSFLDELNKSVLAELHTVREQYDQIWQSTVLALESQRDRSERDMMALSSRLNLLADEVVFQKRMAIVQAIILLSCLFLIIFSRGVSLPSLAQLVEQAPNSPDGAPASPATLRQFSYQERTKHRSDGHSTSSSSDIAVEVPTICPQATHTVTSDKPAPYDAKLFHDADEINSDSSAFQRLSPPSTPNFLDEVHLPENSDAGSNFSHPHCTGGTLHINSRKPLPSLPEHPRSLDEE